MVASSNGHFGSSDQCPYSWTIDAYGHPDYRGCVLLTRMTDGVRAEVPAGLEKLTIFGCTPCWHRDEVLAHSSHHPPRVDQRDLSPLEL